MGLPLQMSVCLECGCILGICILHMAPGQESETVMQALPMHMSFAEMLQAKKCLQQVIIFMNSGRGDIYNPLFLLKYIRKIYTFQLGELHEL